MRELTDVIKAYLAVVFTVAAVVVMFVFAGAALAQPASVPTDLSEGEAIALLLKSVGGLKGAGALTLAAFGVQVVMRFFQTPLAAFAGKWRLLIVYALSLVFGVLSLKVAGVDWMGALVHADTLAALMVLGNQFVKQFQKAT